MKTVLICMLLLALAANAQTVWRDGMRYDGRMRDVTGEERSVLVPLRSVHLLTDLQSGPPMSRGEMGVCEVQTNVVPAEIIIAGRSQRTEWREMLVVCRGQWERVFVVTGFAFGRG